MMNIYFARKNRDFLSSAFAVALWSCAVTRVRFDINHTLQRRSTTRAQPNLKPHALCSAWCSALAAPSPMRPWRMGIWRHIADMYAACPCADRTHALA